MLNIKEELTILAMRKGLSMRKVAAILRENGYETPKASGLSYQLNKKRIRFETVQEILDLFGYDLEIKKR